MTGMKVPTMALLRPSVGSSKLTVPPVFWRPIRNSATIGTAEKSAASGCAGFECATMRPRLSTT